MISEAAGCIREMHVCETLVGMHRGVNLRARKSVDTAPLTVVRFLALLMTPSKKQYNRDSRFRLLVSYLEESRPVGGRVNSIIAMLLTDLRPIPNAGGIRSWSMIRSKRPASKMVVMLIVLDSLSLPNEF